ncbi:MAG TPA: ribosome-binding factor A, partial [Archangium sp.]
MSSKPRRTRASHRRAGSDSFSSEEASIPARHLRLQSTLFEEVSLLFRGELSDPLLEGVTVTTLELSPDGRHARIGFTLP